MSDLYGSWLTENYDYSEVQKNLAELHTKHYDLYIRRVHSINGLAEMFVENSITIFPSLAGKIHVNYAHILAGIGRYVNDIVHYKLWHKVPVTNRAKMIAHTVKWIIQYPPVVATVSENDYKNLPDEAKSFTLGVSALFSALVIRYFLNFFHQEDGTEVPCETRYRKIFYLIETGQYDAKNATLIFEGLL